jgi:glycogen operon protein
MRDAGLWFHAIFNAWWHPLDFFLPEAPSPWRRWIDTSRPSPHDIVPWREAEVVSAPSFHASARSVVCFYAGEAPRGVTCH